MIIKMTRTVPGAANDAGTATMSYMAGSRYDMSADWQQDLAVVFLNEDWAYEVGAKMATPVVENKMLDGAPENKGAAPAEDAEAGEAPETKDGTEADEHRDEVPV